MKEPNKIRKAVLRTAVLLLVAGCAFASRRYAVLRKRLYEPPPTLCSTIRTGDLLFSEGRSLKSDLVRIASARYRSEFSHVGFLRPRDGEVRVVHMSIDDGYIVEEPLADFIRRNRVPDIGIRRLRDAPDSGRLCRVLDSLLSMRKPFDYDFSLEDEQAYYCTELIVKALEAAGSAGRAEWSAEGGILYPARLDDRRLLTEIEP